MAAEELDYINSNERMVGAGHVSLADTLNRALRDALTKSGYDPDAAFTGLAGPVFNVKAYGAVGDGVTDDTVAIQAALDAAAAAQRGKVLIPAGQYVVTSQLSVTTSGRIKIEGDGTAASIMLNQITGAAADAMLAIDGLYNFFVIEGLEIRGNGLTGDSGNGNALSFINTDGGAGVTTFGPQQVVIRDCFITAHRGTGGDHSGASIPSCGVYMYAGTVFHMDNVTISSCATGLRAETYEKAYFHHVTIDACDKNGVYLDTCASHSFVSCVLNGSGSGGATDGLVFTKNCETITFVGCRLKNGKPYLVNLEGTTFANGNISFVGCDFRQLDGTNYGHTAITVASSCQNFAVRDSLFEFESAITDAVGVDFTQGAGGYSLLGAVVENCDFFGGSGGTITAGVRVNIATNKARGVRVVGCRFGTAANYGASTAITDGIRLDGNCEDALILNNHFVAGNNLTITNAINQNGASVLYSTLLGNTFLVPGTGAITNQYGGTSTNYSKVGQGVVLWRGASTWATDVGDAGATLTVGSSSPVQRWATTLTAARTATLSTTGAINGDQFVVLRTGGGNFGLSIGSNLLVLRPNQYGVLQYNGSAWAVVGYGSLAGQSEAITNINNASSPYTVTSIDRTITCDASSGAITVNLPAGSSFNGRILAFVKTDSSANAVTIARAGSDTIAGATSYTLTGQYDFVEIQVGTNGNWNVISAGRPNAAWAAKTGDYTVLDSDSGLFLGGTSHTLTLQSAATRTRPLVLRSTASGVWTITRAGSDTVEGATSINLNAGEAISLMPSGTNWLIVS